jgi:hypothetical protein
MAKVLVLVLALLFAWHPELSAAEVLDRPWGIFICRGPSQTPEREVDFPFARGWLVRPGWNQIEPEEGHYDWTFIDKEIALARKLNKRVALALQGGPQAPDWLFQNGAKKFEYRFIDFAGKETGSRIPVLWDDVYLQKWTALIRAAGKRYDSNNTVMLVHMTAASENGLEMQLPHAAADERRWKEIGYTHDKAVAAWKQVVNAFADAFPHKPLDVDIHPVLGSDRLAEKVTGYGKIRVGKRFGIFGGWLSGRPLKKDEYHAGMHPLAARYGKSHFAAFQLIASQVHDPKDFEGGELKSAIEQGLGWGACYFEVWEIDAMEPRMHPILKQLAERTERAGRERPTLD